MNVSIDIYRQSIGVFVQRVMKARTCSEKSRKIHQVLNTYPWSVSSSLERENNKSDFIKCILMYTILFFLLINVKYTENSVQGFRSFGCNRIKMNEDIHTNHLIQVKDQRRKETGVSWSYTCSSNKLSHSLYGNRRNIGYRYFSWNCDRGYLAKHKIEDVKKFAVKHKPQFMGINEVDLRRNESNTNEKSTNQLSTNQIHEKLKIEGYKLILPASWMKHDKARIIVYVDEEINVKVKNPNDEECHIQNILLEVGFGKSKKHLVGFYYREWKSCVTGLGSQEHQYRNLEILVNIWRKFLVKDQDFVALGDMNLCALKWNDQGYIFKDMAELVKDFMMEENCYQLVREAIIIQNR